MKADKNHEGEMDLRLKAKEGGWRSETMDYSVRHETGARRRECDGERHGEKDRQRKRDTKLVYVMRWKIERVHNTQDTRLLARARARLCGRAHVVGAGDDEKSARICLIDRKSVV